MSTGHDVSHMTIFTSDVLVRSIPFPARRDQGEFYSFVYKKIFPLGRETLTQMMPMVT